MNLSNVKVAGISPMLLTTIAANAERYILNQSAPAQVVPDVFKGTLTILGITAAIEKETTNDKYRYSALRCNVLLSSSSDVLDLWLPTSTVTAAILHPNAIFESVKGRAYLNKDNEKVQRNELVTTVKVSAMDVSMLMSALAQKALFDSLQQPETTKQDDTNGAKALANVNANGDNTPPEADDKP